MNRMTPDLARLLVAQGAKQRLDQASQRQRRHAAHRAGTTGPEIPQQRRATGLLARILPRTGVRVPTR